MTDCVTTALDAKIAQFQEDVDIVHQIAQGGATVVVATENGPIPSIANVIASFNNDLRTLGPFEVVVTDPPLTGLTTNGRFWFNSTDKVVRFAVLNDVNMPEVHSITDRDYIAAALSDLKVALENELNTVDQTLMTDITQEIADRKAAVQALQTELDAVEAALGLNADGTLAPITGTNYLNGSPTLLTAVTALDTQLKQTTDQVSNQAYEPLDVVAASTNALTLDVSTDKVHDITLSDNCALSITGAIPAGVGYGFTLIVRQDSIGGHALTWPTGTEWQNATPPTLTTTPGSKDIFTFITTDGGVTWFALTTGLNFG